MLVVGESDLRRGLRQLLECPEPAKLPCDSLDKMSHERRGECVAPEG